MSPATLSTLYKSEGIRGYEKAPATRQGPFRRNKELIGGLVDRLEFFLVELLELVGVAVLEYEGGTATGL